MTVTLATLLVFGLGASLSATNATTVKAIDTIVADGSFAPFTLAQTNGMDRRQDRRDTRQDCRAEGGLVGADKRNCKQEGRSGDDDKTTTTPDTDDGTKE